VLFSSVRSGLNKALVVVVSTMEGRAKLSQRRYGGRKDGARAFSHGPAVDGAKVALRQRVRNGPEAGEWLTSIENWGTSVVLHAVDVQQHTERNPSLPLIRPIFLNADLGGKASRALVHNRAPQHLRDAVG
jgi:hypothetical protein